MKLFDFKTVRRETVLQINEYDTLIFNISVKFVFMWNVVGLYRSDVMEQVREEVEL